MRVLGVYVYIGEIILNQAINSNKKCKKSMSTTNTKNRNTTKYKYHNKNKKKHTKIKKTN
jgi:hypothetical protein